MRGRVYIRCDWPKQRHPFITELPGLAHCKVYVRAEDGREIEVEGVTSIAFECAGSNVATARILVHGVELDAEALLASGAEEK